MCTRFCYCFACPTPGCDRKQQPEDADERERSAGGTAPPLPGEHVQDIPGQTQLLRDHGSMSWRRHEIPSNAPGKCSSVLADCRACNLH